MRKGTIGIRKETKDNTQRRAPLSPDSVRRLIEVQGLRVVVEPWENRIFNDREYAAAGATLSTDLSECNVIFGVKEITVPHLSHRSAYCFFSHTVKGQDYNMPMLRDILRRNVTLFDYELVRDDKGKRLVFFGSFAGYAGLIDTLWALGKRLAWEKIPNPFSSILYANEYGGLGDAKEALKTVGLKIASEGLPKEIVPFVTAFTGYGRVSKAAQELYDILPCESIAPRDLRTFMASGNYSDRKVYKCEFRKPDLYAETRTRGEAGVDEPFDLELFNREPGRFHSRFAEYLPYLGVVVNGIYWEPRFPRLISIGEVKMLFAPEAAGGSTSRVPPRLRVIGDITCDIGGSVELTVRETNSTNPIFVYDPESGETADGWEGRGPVVMAVDKLPTELPREASQSFGNTLEPFVPHLARADYSQPLPALDIPVEFRRALIAHAGELTPEFSYLHDDLLRVAKILKESRDS